jgi:hypothetical protein
MPERFLSRLVAFADLFACPTWSNVQLAGAGSASVFDRGARARARARTRSELSSIVSSIAQRGGPRRRRAGCLFRPSMAVHTWAMLEPVQRAQLGRWASLVKAARPSRRSRPAELPPQGESRTIGEADIGQHAAAVLERVRVRRTIALKRLLPPRQSRGTSYGRSAHVAIRHLGDGRRGRAYQTLSISIRCGMRLALL